MVELKHSYTNSNAHHSSDRARIRRRSYTDTVPHPMYSPPSPSAADSSAASSSDSPSSASIASSSSTASSSSLQSDGTSTPPPPEHHTKLRNKRRRPLTPNLAPVTLPVTNRNRSPRLRIARLKKPNYAARDEDEHEHEHEPEPEGDCYPESHSRSHTIQKTTRRRKKRSSLSSRKSPCVYPTHTDSKYDATPEATEPTEPTTTSSSDKPHVTMKALSSLISQDFTDFLTTPKCSICQFHCESSSHGNVNDTSSTEDISDTNPSEHSNKLLVLPPCSCATRVIHLNPSVVKFLSLAESLLPNLLTDSNHSNDNTSSLDSDDNSPLSSNPRNATKPHDMPISITNPLFAELLSKLSLKHDWNHIFLCRVCLEAMISASNEVIEYDYRSVSQPNVKYSMGTKCPVCQTKFSQRGLATLMSRFGIGKDGGGSGAARRSSGDSKGSNGNSHSPCGQNEDELVMDITRRVACVMKQLTPLNCSVATVPEEPASTSNTTGAKRRILSGKRKKKGSRSARNSRNPQKRKSATKQQLNSSEYAYVVSTLGKQTVVQRSPNARIPYTVHSSEDAYPDEEELAVRHQMCQPGEVLSELMKRDPKFRQEQEDRRLIEEKLKTEEGRMELGLVGSEVKLTRPEVDAGLVLIHEKLQTVKGREELGLDPTDRVFIKGGGVGSMNVTTAAGLKKNPLSLSAIIPSLSPLPVNVNVTSQQQTQPHSTSQAYTHVHTSSLTRSTSLCSHSTTSSCNTSHNHTQSNTQTHKESSSRALRHLRRTMIDIDDVDQMVEIRTIEAERRQRETSDREMAKKLQAKYDRSANLAANLFTEYRPNMACSGHGHANAHGHSASSRVRRSTNELGDVSGGSISGGARRMLRSNSHTGETEEIAVAEGLMEATVEVMAMGGEPGDEVLVAAEVQEVAEVQPCLGKQPPDTNTNLTGHNTHSPDNTQQQQQPQPPHKQPNDPPTSTSAARPLSHDLFDFHPTTHTSASTSTSTSTTSTAAADVQRSRTNDPFDFEESCSSAAVDARVDAIASSFLHTSSPSLSVVAVAAVPSSSQIKDRETRSLDPIVQAATTSTHGNHNNTGVTASGTSPSSSRRKKRKKKHLYTHNIKPKSSPSPTDNNTPASTNSVPTSSSSSVPKVVMPVYQPVCLPKQPPSLTAGTTPTTTTTLPENDNTNTALSEGMTAAQMVMESLKLRMTDASSGRKKKRKKTKRMGTTTHTGSNSNSNVNVNVNSNINSNGKVVTAPKVLLPPMSLTFDDDDTLSDNMKDDITIPPHNRTTTGTFDLGPQPTPTPTPTQTPTQHNPVHRNNDTTSNRPFTSLSIQTKKRTKKRKKSEPTCATPPPSSGRGEPDESPVATTSFLNNCMAGLMSTPNSTNTNTNTPPASHSIAATLTNSLAATTATSTSTSTSAFPLSTHNDTSNTKLDCTTSADSYPKATDATSKRLTTSTVRKSKKKRRTKKVTKKKNNRTGKLVTPKTTQHGLEIPTANHDATTSTSTPNTTLLPSSTTVDASPLSSSSNSPVGLRGSLLPGLASGPGRFPTTTQTTTQTHAGSTHGNTHGNSNVHSNGMVMRGHLARKKIKLPTAATHTARQLKNNALKRGLPVSTNSTDTCSNTTLSSTIVSIQSHSTLSLASNSNTNSNSNSDGSDPTHHYANTNPPQNRNTFPVTPPPPCATATATTTTTTTTTPHAVRQQQHTRTHTATLLTNASKTQTDYSNSNTVPHHHSPGLAFGVFPASLSPARDITSITSRRDENVNELVIMGFDRSRVISCLNDSDGDVNRAIAMLCSES